MSLFGEFTKGFIKENPVLKLALGLCPTLAVTTSIENGIGMGLSTTAVLLGSNIFVSLLKKVIPSKIRIPAYIIIIASFVTIVELVLKGFVPDLYASLGLFIPLIVVNCIILGRAEAFASKKNVVVSTIDAFGMGFGFTLTLALLGGIREIMGTGSLFGSRILWESYSQNPMLIQILAPGAFLTLGLILGVMNLLEARSARKLKEVQELERISK